MKGWRLLSCQDTYANMNIHNEIFGRLLCFALHTRGTFPVLPSYLKKSGQQSDHWARILCIEQQRLPEPHFSHDWTEGDLPVAAPWTSAFDLWSWPINSCWICKQVICLIWLMKIQFSQVWDKAAVTVLWTALTPVPLSSLSKQMVIRHSGKSQN